MNPRRLGALGTFVWDTVHHPDLDEPLEQWGGLAYSLSAFAAACPIGYTVVPVARLGEDLADAAHRFLASLPNLSVGPALETVPEPNNRVELRYRDRAERTETLTGGVPPWTWPDLAPRVADVDALYVNHMSGRELPLEVALELRRHFPGPIYVDLHSLFLEDPTGGPRGVRRLPRWREWLGTGDIVQLNEVERGLIGEPGAPPPSLAELVGFGPAAVFVTRGAEGAQVAARGPLQQPLELAASRGARASAAGIRPRSHDEALPVAVAEIPLGFPPSAGDPTGCGDVWGSVAFAGILEGRPLDVAVRRGHVAAAARLRHGRMDGLAAAISSALRAYDASA